MDRWTDRIAMAKTHYSSSCCCVWKEYSKKHGPASSNAHISYADILLQYYEINSIQKNLFF